MNCPKCNSTEIHTWVVCVCYNCGFSGDARQFNATKEELESNFKFREIILDMNHTKLKGLEWIPKSEHERDKKMKMVDCSKCAMPFFKRLMFGVNVYDAMVYKNVKTLHYCDKCAKELFGVSRWTRDIK